MNKDKQKFIQNQNKFEHTMFAVDYLQNMYQLTGTINHDDFLACLVRLYEIAYSEGRQDTLDNYIYKMFEDLDEIANNK